MATLFDQLKQKYDDKVTEYGAQNVTKYEASIHGPTAEDEFGSIQFTISTDSETHDEKIKLDRLLTAAETKAFFNLMR